MKMTAKILVVIGAINWGLVGIGMLLNSDWNIVRMIFGFIWSPLEAIVYILVGLSAVMLLCGCKCGKCKGTCNTETPAGAPATEEKA